jgi:hypothetical protein
LQKITAGSLTSAIARWPIPELQRAARISCAIVSSGFTASGGGYE